MADKLYLTPGTGETLEFGTSATVSGVLSANEIYRLTCDVDCWVDFDLGGGGMGAADSNAMLMQADTVEYLRTTDANLVLHALGVTTSGLLNYIKMHE